MLFGSRDRVNTHTQTHARTTADPRQLSRNYAKALERVSKELEFFPKHLQHRSKQRLTKIHQYLIRMRKLKLKAKPKLVTINPKVWLSESFASSVRSARNETKPCPNFLCARAWHAIVVKFVVCRTHPAGYFFCHTLAPHTKKQNKQVFFRPVTLRARMSRVETGKHEGVKVVFGRT